MLTNTSGLSCPAAASHRPIAARAGGQTAAGAVCRAVHYGDVLRVPHVRRLLAGTLIGRLPSGMAPLALLLTGAQDTGYATASGLVSLYLLSSAVGGPLTGHMVDHTGQTLVFTAGAIVSGTALVLVTAGSWCAVVGVVAAGAARPPLESGLRTLWGSGAGSMLPTRDHQRVALSLEASAQELIYVMGPLLAASIAWAASPSAALWATATAGIAGTVLVVTAPPSRAWTAVPGRADWLGPLRTARLRTLYAAMVWAGVPIGALTPLAVQAATRSGTPWLSAALPAALSAGAVLGGLGYGSRTWPGTTRQHLVVLSGAFALGWLPVTVAGDPATVVAATAVPGLVMAPLFTVAVVMTGSLAPPGTSTEAHALLVAALGIGCAAGAAVAGLVPTVVLLPAGAALAALLLAARRGASPAPAQKPLAP
ncbi:MFS transporter [Streptomyces sp. NPDC088747]|uniref:MFS transporter n=1 Tax=Streptomyces sp. NPDC088747 TaxID=3365886 RepID=UPI0037FE2CD9